MTKEIEKDYSLLRPFDLEKAKAGEAIMWVGIDDSSAQFVGGPDCDGDFAIMDCFNRFQFRPASDLRMSPLCWVEGKPVYKGDVLYSNIGPRTIIGIDGEYLQGSSGDQARWGLFKLDGLTWTPPKVKREGWVNVYPSETHRHGTNISPYAYPSKEVADAHAQKYRIACIRIEWEE